MKTVLTNKKQIIAFQLLCCFVYFMSYLTRLNYAAGLAEIRLSLGITRQLASLPVTAGFITYGAGQLVCGFLGDRFSPRKMICFGLLATSVCNLAVSAVSNIGILTMLWCLNGLFQSMLWPPLVRLMAENLTEEDYKNTCVQVSIASSVATIAVYILAPVCILYSGWRMLFLLPALLGIAAAFIWLAGIGRIRAARENAVSGMAVEQAYSKSHISMKAIILQSALIPILGAIILHGILRDGITTWMPAYIGETFGLSTSLSILTTAILPLFAVFSISIASAILQRLKNELLVAALLFGCGAAASVLLLPFYSSSAVISVAMMTLITGSMHGVNLMLISRVPRHFSRFGRVATVSGILNASTYVGSALSTYAFAAISDRFGWMATIIVWCVTATGGILLCSPYVRKWAQFRK